MAVALLPSWRVETPEVLALLSAEDSDPLSLLGMSKPFYVSVAPPSTALLGIIVSPQSSS